MFGAIPHRKFNGMTQAFELSAPHNRPGCPPPILTQLGPNAFMNATVVPLDATHWNLEFQVSQKAPIGQHSTKFAIGTAEHPEIAIIPVLLNITENVALRPRIVMLDLHEIDSAEIDVYGLETDLLASMLAIPPDQGVRLVSTTQITPNRVRVKLEFDAGMMSTLPKKIRIDVQDLGSLELFCVKAQSTPISPKSLTATGLEGEPQ